MTIAAEVQEIRKNWTKDLLASFVVFLVALPLCMGVAIASGMPPALGIITGMIGGMIVGVIQGAPLQVSGPAAGLTVIVYELVQRHGLENLGPVIMIAGLVQLVVGFAKGGRWFRAVPPSVIHGMLGGIGVLIFASQFHVMVDDRPKANGIQNLISLPGAVWKGIRPQPNLPHEEAAITGVLTIVVLMLWNKFSPAKLKAIPGALVAVVFATVVSRLLNFPIAHVNVPESITSVMNFPTAESLARLTTPSVIASGVAVAIVASAETLLCAAAVDKMHTGPRTNYNREMVAQGVGNMLCGIVGALPMTGVIVRSSTNVQAGGKSRLSAILHGVWLFGLVMLLPFVLRLIPVSSLAAILVFTGYKLINPPIFKELRRYGLSEALIYVTTIVAIVSTDLLKGVFIGLALAVAKLLYTFSHLDIRTEIDTNARRTTLYLNGSATFLRLPDIAEALALIPSNHEILVKFENLVYLDHAVLEELRSWEKQHNAKGGDVVIDWDALDQKYHTARHRRSHVEVSLADVPDAVLPAPMVKASEPTH